MFEIFADSAGNLTVELMREYNIKVISYKCFIDGKETVCFDENDITDEKSKMYYNAMRNGSDVKTSLINVDTFINAFRPEMEKGRDILFIGLSSGVSGTIQSANIAAEILKEEFPERKCVVFDSLSASLGEGIQVCDAAIQRSKGLTLKETEEWLKVNVFKMRHIFTVDNLHYLKKNGRLSSAATIAGTVLNLKPILTATNEGKIVLKETVRGRKKALNKMLEDFKANIINAEEQIIGLAHCDCFDDAQYIANKIKEFCNVKKIVITYYDWCTGSHVGPDTLALFYKGLQR